MKSKYIITQIICILLISNPLAIYAQSDLYYWGYKTKYPLTSDSLQAVLIPKNVNKQLNFQSLNYMVESESVSALANRQEVMLKLKNTSTLKNQKFSEFHLLPVFKSGDFPLIPTGEIVFQPKANVNYQQVIAFCKGKITFQHQSKYGTITVIPQNIVELLSLANQIYQSGLVEWCEPNFIVEIIKHQQIPTDQFFGQQYYLNQNNNIDINAPEAWQLSTGLNGVRVAVIDDGVEAHDDLNGRVLQGFTPLDPNGFGAPTNNLPPPNEGIIGHGQACAGIIGATHNNVGVAGVSPCSEIVPVNIFNSWFLDFNFPPGQRLRWVEDAQDIAEAINWAWDDGEAEVLSNSWGYGTTNPNNIPQSGQIIQAINDARTQGRGGFGSVVVFSSGNSNQQFNGVTFPANVEGVITVGAIDRNGNIHSYSSRGSQMDLVAPSGGNPGDVVTIDRMGDLGYNDGDNPNYAFEFNGTSAAAPQVSGAAALILSVNPYLTETQVRTILQQTATDMGSSGFDNTFGFGRVNAQAAVQAALPTISGPSIVCTTNSTFNLTNPPLGATVSWNRSRNLTLSVSNQNSITVKANSSSVKGNGWIRATISGECGSFDVQNSFWIGKSDKSLDGISLYPQFAPIYDENTPIELCQGAIVRVTAQNVVGGVPSDLQQTSIVWAAVGGGEIINTGDTWADVRFCNFFSTASIKLRYENPCGEGAWTSVPVQAKSPLDCNGSNTCDSSGGGDDGSGDDDGGDGPPLNPVEPCDCGDQFICECLNSYQISTQQNPVNNSFEFQITEIPNEERSGLQKSRTDDRISVSIYNNQRTKLFEGNLSASEIKEFIYDSRDLPNGIYLVNFENAGEQVQFRILKTGR